MVTSACVDHGPDDPPASPRRTAQATSSREEGINRYAEPERYAAAEAKADRAAKKFYDRVARLQDQGSDDRRRA